MSLPTVSSEMVNRDDIFCFNAGHSGEDSVKRGKSTILLSKDFCLYHNVFGGNLQRSQVIYSFFTDFQSQGQIMSPLKDTEPC